MKTLKKYIAEKYLIAKLSVAEFVESERGDTNFVSMLLIIGIVVVLAGLFLTLMRTTIWTNITTKVTEFFNELG